MYPDLWGPRIGYVLADLCAVLWAVLWAYIGSTIYHTIMTLSVIANGVIAAGRTLNDAISQVQRDVAGLPLIGANLRDALNPLHNVPASLITTGQHALVAIHNVALLLGVVVGGVPLLVLLITYIPWRIRKTRGFRNLNRMLRQPGARAIPETLQVLAGRAIYTLPYERLLQFSPDPIGEWRDGRYFNLARATMAEEGLSVQRYMRRNAAFQPPVLGEPHATPEDQARDSSAPFSEDEKP